MQLPLTRGIDRQCLIGRCCCAIQCADNAHRTASSRERSKVRHCERVVQIDCPPRLVNRADVLPVASQGQTAITDRHRHSRHSDQLIDLIRAVQIHITVGDQRPVHIPCEVVHVERSRQTLQYSIVDDGQSGDAQGLARLRRYLALDDQRQRGVSQRRKV